MDEARGQIIGSRVKELRVATGLSLRQFAEKAGFNPNVLSRIERGAHNMTLETLFRLCRELDALPEDILRDLR